MSTTTQKFSSIPIYDHEHFERLYTSHIDPWSVLTSRYEREKFQATVDALHKPMYDHILELGCSIGGLTRLLAPRCKALTAVDTSTVALDRARKLCAQPHIRFLQAHLPDGDWRGKYDLVVLSEVLYYFNVASLVRLAELLTHVVTPTTCFVVVHWTGETDYPLSGDGAMDLFRDLMRAERTTHQRRTNYRLEVWTGSRLDCDARS